MNTLLHAYPVIGIMLNNYLYCILQICSTYVYSIISMQYMYLYNAMTLACVCLTWYCAKMNFDTVKSVRGHMESLKR